MSSKECFADYPENAHVYSVDVTPKRSSIALSIRSTKRVVSVNHTLVYNDRNVSYTRFTISDMGPGPGALSEGVGGATPRWHTVVAMNNFHTK